MSRLKFWSKLPHEEAISHLAAEYYFGPGIQARGSLKTDSDIYIDCEFEGSIETQGVIEIDANAIVKADLTCRTMSLAGNLHGNVAVVEQASLAGNASYTGKLRCSNLKIDQGARINGQILTKDQV